MDNRNNLIIEMALSGVSINKITEILREKGIPTSKKTVGKVLSDNGYSYDKKNSKWIGNGENIILEHKKEDAKASKPVKTNDNKAIPQLSNEEILFIRELMQQQKEIVATTAESHSIYDEIAKLKVKDRKNKTFFISEDITKDFVAFAEGLNVQISKLVEVAFMELLDKYKK